MCTIHWPSALHRVGEAVAVTAREKSHGTVKLRNLPAAIHSVGLNIAYEPRSLAAQPAWRPAYGHPLMNGLRILTVRSDAIVEVDFLLAAVNDDPRSVANLGGDLEVGAKEGFSFAPVRPQSGRRDRSVRHAPCKPSLERIARSEIGRPNPRIPSWGSSNARPRTEARPGMRPLRKYDGGSIRQ
jgi:hypothetical protein